MRPTYDFDRSYDWNYEHGPLFEGELPSIAPPAATATRLAGLELASPLGIPAGLLLNSRWVELYARLGFDLLTYKTVRTRQYPCLPAPNCLLVDTKGQLTPERFSEKLVARAWPPEEEIGRPHGGPVRVSITNSFGMPSQAPREWQPDVERARRSLVRGQLLAVSVVGTFEEGEGAEAFIRDFVLGARLAAEAGADIVELNLSCPNSCAREGALYTDAELSSRLVRSVKREIGAVPLFVKVGVYADRRTMETVVGAVAPFVQGIVGINTLKMAVIGLDGRPALPGQGRTESGICGIGIQDCGLRFVEALSTLKDEQKYDFAVVGVGGVFSPGDVNAYRERGADAVQTCTGAMFDPHLAAVYRRAGGREC